MQVETETIFTITFSVISDSKIHKKITEKTFSDNNA